MPDVLTLRVNTVVEATPRTRILQLDLGDSPFVFRAGQAALIGLHGQPQRRPYSLASAPEDATRHGWLEFLLKVDQFGYAGPHLASLPHDARVDLEGPFGSFTLPDPTDASGFLFVAGGTGISPLRAMLRHLIASEESRPIAVIYSARTADEFAYASELQQLAHQGRITLTQTLTGTMSDDLLSEWRGGRGRIGQALLAQALPASDPLCFICGPPALVEDVPPLLLQLGVRDARIRTEEW